MASGRLRDVALGVIMLCVLVLAGLALVSTVAPSDGVAGVSYAKGTAHCKRGTYNGVSTGTNKGRCAVSAESQEPGEVGWTTVEYTCDDRAGNKAVVNCLDNNGMGSCQSEGRGSCGEFVTTNQN